MPTGGYRNLYGPSLTPIAPSPASHFGGAPEAEYVNDGASNTGDKEEAVVTWARNARGTLKRERQEITTEMTEALQYARGETPFWSNRPSWKMSTRLNKCYTVPAKWKSILTDSEQTVTYSSTRSEGQRTAAVLTTAFSAAYTEGEWAKVIGQCVFSSRIVKKSFLSLRPDIFNKDRTRPILTCIPGTQVYVDRNATCIDDAEVVLYEYRQSYGKVIARFPDIRDHLERKYQSIYDPHDTERGGSITAPPATLNLPTGSTVNNPPYVGAPNPPEDASGTSGILITEFWTRPHTTDKVSVPMFTAAGEPTTIPAEVEYEDGTTELLRRIVTEGHVVYELPISIVDGLLELQLVGGLQILDEMDAVRCVKHKVDSLRYPDGRVLIIVDDSIKPDDGDKMNPLGYFPFIEVESHPDPGGMFYGLSDIDLIKSPYESWIRLASNLFDNANLAANALWRIPENSILTNDDITNAPGGIQREDLATLKYGKREAAPDMPPYVMQLLSYYEQKIDDLSGLTAAMLGKVSPKAQQSTDTNLQQQEAGSIDVRDAQRSLKLAIRKLGVHFQKYVERFYTTPKLFEIKNQLGQKESVPLLGTHLDEEYHVDAKPGSMMSSTPTARLTTAMNLVGSGLPLMDLPAVWELLEEVGAIRSAKELERRITLERTDPRTKWLVPGADGAPKKNAKKPNSKRAKSGPTQGAG
jgi:hypothetical protein